MEEQISGYTVVTCSDGSLEVLETDGVRVFDIPAALANHAELLIEIYDDGYTSGVIEGQADLRSNIRNVLDISAEMAWIRQ